MPQGDTNFRRIISSESVVHWFAENRDVYHPKISSMPTGMIGEDLDNEYDFSHIEYIPLHERPKMIMSADRLRAGAQWRDRWLVESWCLNTSYCMRPMAPTAGSNLNRSSYLSIVASVPFVACVHGGGLDPSPKAWETILAGTIPIIRRNAVSDAYEHLPVAFVTEWADLFLDEKRGRQMMDTWLKKLSPYYVKGSALRRRTLNVIGVKRFFLSFLSFPFLSFRFLSFLVSKYCSLSVSFVTFTSS